MSAVAAESWLRALRSLGIAESSLDASPDDSASRAYYAAFHSVTALFALEGRVFRSHAQANAAVHRDLVRTGRVPAAFGADFTKLWDLRGVGDYGGPEHVEPDEAREAVAAARRVLETVRAACPQFGERTPQ